MINKVREKVVCPLCGGKFTTQGYSGHMRFKHGRDHKAPMLSVERPASVSELRKRVFDLESIIYH